MKECVVGVWDACRQKFYSDDSCPSQLQSLAEVCSRLELKDKWVVSYVPQVKEKQIVRICLYVYVCVAPPMILGAWSMAVVLW